MRREEKARKIRTQLTQIANTKNSWSINELRIVLGLERIVARLIHHKQLEQHLIYKGGFVLMKIPPISVMVKKERRISRLFELLFDLYFAFNTFRIEFIWRLPMIDTQSFPKFAEALMH